MTAERKIQSIKDILADLPMAGMAAKIEELVERLDGTDRRVAALNEGLKDAGDLLLQHEDRVTAIHEMFIQRNNAVNTRINNANGYFNLIMDYLGVRLDATKNGPALTSDEGKTGLVERIGNIQDRVTEIERTSEHAMVNRRLYQLATDISKLGANLARIEDMLTAEKPAMGKLVVDPGHNQTFSRLRVEIPNPVDEQDSRVAGVSMEPSGALHLCQCTECDRLRRNYKPKRIIKGGWVNVYWNERRGVALVGGIHPTKATADEEGSCRVACIQIPDFTEGDGL